MQQPALSSKQESRCIRLLRFGILDRAPNSRLDATSPIVTLSTYPTWRGKLQACSGTGAAEPGIGFVVVSLWAALPGGRDWDLGFRF